MASLADIDERIRSEIENRLGSIESQEGVRYRFAVESGSRAWVFPSPDSDYDVRFVYVRPRDWYLSIKAGRDVIETPLVDEIDLNGWDIRKALGLLLKSNVIVSEWLESPIRYRADDNAVSTFRELADGLFDPSGAARHYASLGQTAAERWMAGLEPVAVKVLLCAPSRLGVAGNASARRSKAADEPTAIAVPLRPAPVAQSRHRRTGRTQERDQRTGQCAALLGTGRIHCR